MERSEIKSRQKELCHEYKQTHPSKKIITKLDQCLLIYLRELSIYQDRLLNDGSSLISNDRIMIKGDYVSTFKTVSLKIFHVENMLCRRMGLSSSDYYEVKKLYDLIGRRRRIKRPCF